MKAAELDFDEIERSGTEPLEVAERPQVVPVETPTRETPRAADPSRQKWIDEHYLEEGRAYTFAVEKRRGANRDRGWEIIIKQADCPWSIVALKCGFHSKLTATRWARAYLKRGGPPEGYFDRPPDRNRIVFRKR